MSRSSSERFDESSLNCPDNSGALRLEWTIGATGPLDVNIFSLDVGEDLSE